MGFEWQLDRSENAINQLKSISYIDESVAAPTRPPPPLNFDARGAFSIRNGFDLCSPTIGPRHMRVTDLRCVGKRHGDSSERAALGISGRRVSL